MKTAVIASLVCFLYSAAAFAQRRVEFEFGIRTGVPVTDTLNSPKVFTGDFTQRVSIDQPGFTIGPMFGAIFFNRVSAEFDALYKRIAIVEQTTGPGFDQTSTTRAGMWEFPLIFDYHFLKRTLRPYAGGGIDVGQFIEGRTETVVVSSFTSLGPLGPFYSYRPAVSYLTHHPYVANAGVRWNVSHITVRPEIRYTHSKKLANFPQRSGDQIDFLIGVSIGSRFSSDLVGTRDITLRYD